MRVLLALSFALGGPIGPFIPHGPSRPHPVALRRERINRQLAHTRGRKGHR